LKLAGQENINHFFSCLTFLGIETVFICPGSRNAPLIHAAVLQAGLKTLSVPDERSAAYMALGASRQTNKPVAVCCTSGTAALNFFPAVAEAHYLQIPVLFLTADRPEEFVDRWDNQVIRQRKMFESYVNKSFSWKGILNRNRSLGKVERIAGKAFQALSFPQKGPVHVNFHFDEPLYFQSVNKIHKPFSLPLKPQHTFQKRTLPKDGINISDKIMLLSGLGEYDSKEEKLLVELTKKGHLLLCDIQSPYRHLQTCSDWEWFFYRTKEIDIKSYLPQTLITFGRQLLNKNLKNLIRKNPPLSHYHIASHGIIRDPFFTNPSVVTPDMLMTLFPDANPSYISLWNNAFDNISKVLNTKKDNEFSDYGICKKLAEMVNPETVIHVSNSMPVRYVSLANFPSSFKIYSNRGTSGIDGCTSSAAGAAIVSPEKQHLLITGDLAFFYDRNGLWSEPKPQNLKILILNNAGGNIFDLIPGPDESPYKRFLTTPHSMYAENTAKDFGFSYYFASEWETFSTEYHQWMDDKNPSIFEVKTDPELNKTTWNQLKKTL
jgi:2-succinyl-5-enolpyruvyl-6-hydroxy-3-cyclohexene-1-carboxylate synthase